VIRQFVLAISIIALAPTTMYAWLYPEHRDITLLALETLKPEQRSVLDKLWSEARVGHETTLCRQIADAAQVQTPTCLDYGAWPALGGDHSCSARELLDEVLEAPWVLKVAAVGARLDVKLAAAKRRDQITNAVLRSNIDLLRADPDN
jgi:hypothetical protein